MNIHLIEFCFKFQLFETLFIRKRIFLNVDENLILIHLSMIEIQFT